VAGAYLLILCAGLGCMALLDRRFTLLLWRSPGRGLSVLLTGLLFFLLWDLAAIRLGVFFRAEDRFMTGVLLAPELPLEEAFFLTFLCYFTMIVYTGAPELLGR
jgi:lycopene cyclase domain-containing protein